MHKLNAFTNVLMIKDIQWGLVDLAKGSQVAIKHQHPLLVCMKPTSSSFVHTGEQIFNEQFWNGFTNWSNFWET